MKCFQCKKEIKGKKYKHYGIDWECKKCFFKNFDIDFIRKEISVLDFIKYYYQTN